MASVTGITAERANQIWNDSIVNGDIDESGQLILETRGGVLINAGPIISPKLAVEKSYPVGSIRLSTSATNPADNSQLGVGVWAPWGAGRVPTGVDGTKPEFDSVEKTGGFIKHALTVAQMPAHGHGGTANSTSIDVDMSSVAASSNPVGSGSVLRGAAGGTRGLTGSTHSHSITTDVRGSGDEHPILQPYITCYMWKRTA